MRFLRSFLSVLAPLVIVFLFLPASAQARTAVIIGDSQGQGLRRPLTQALEGFDITVTDSSVHPGKGLNWFLTSNTISSMVSSRHPELVILVIGGNDDVTSGNRSTYESRLRQAYTAASGSGAQVVWIGPATSRDSGVQERHDRTASAQSSIVPGLGARWIDGRSGSAAGPFQQDSNPGTGASQIRSRNTHLSGEGYRRWSCTLAPQISGGGTSTSCPAGTEADEVFPDAVADVDDPSAGIASAGYSTTCDTDGAPVPITLGISIGGVTQVSGLPQYINTVYRYLVSIILVVAIVMVVYGGFLYLVGSAGISSAQRGKQIIRDALIGMVVVLAAYAILQTINVNTTNLSLNPASIECVAIAPESRANADEGGANIPACVKDSQCRDGRVCLRTQGTEGLSSGQCTQGRANELCRCSSGGCDVTTSEDGSPTNNNGTMQVACQVGTCRQAQGSLLGDATGNWTCNTGTDGSQCNMSTDPPVTCATGFFCEQNGPTAPGRCVGGNARDQELSPRPVCSTLGFGPVGSERYYRETEQGTGAFTGGCNLVTSGGVNSYCMANRYHCSTSAADPNRCSEEEFAGMFSNTGGAYNSGGPTTWDFNRAPEVLRPWSFARFGCRKPIGASCASDNECSSMCVNGTCTGFCAVIPSTTDSVPSGALPTAVTDRCTSTGCGDDTWSAAYYLVHHSALPVSDADFGVAFGPMTPEKAACYPLRPAGSKCDFNTQCVTGLTCQPEPGRGPAEVGTSELLRTFHAPLDMTSGLGTCR